MRAPYAPFRSAVALERSFTTDRCVGLWRTARLTACSMESTGALVESVACAWAACENSAGMAAHSAAATSLLSCIVGILLSGVWLSYGTPDMRVSRVQTTSAPRGTGRLGRRGPEDASRELARHRVALDDEAARVERHPEHVARRVDPHVPRTATLFRQHEVARGDRPSRDHHLFVGVPLGAEDLLLRTLRHDDGNGSTSGAQLLRALRDKIILMEDIVIQQHRIVRRDEFTRRFTFGR